MQSLASTQIGFKVSPEIAAKLDALGGPLKLSRNLVAKELVLAGLAATNGSQPIDLFKHRIAGRQAGEANGETQQEEESQVEDLMKDLLLCLKTQNQFIAALELSLKELSGIRHKDIPAIRSDIRTSVAALFCQAGVPIEKAKEWVTTHLGVDIPEADDAQHPANP